MESSNSASVANSKDDALARMKLQIATGRNPFKKDARRGTTKVDYNFWECWRAACVGSRFSVDIMVTPVAHGDEVEVKRPLPDELCGVPISFNDLRSMYACVPKFYLHIALWRVLGDKDRLAVVANMVERAV